MPIVIVFLGGGVGSVCRYLMSVFIGSLWDGAFPLGTFLINIIGCFLIGFLGGLSERMTVEPNLRLLLQTGFLGGFTTFSSFGLETTQLARSGEYGLASANMLASNLVGIAFVFSGFALSRWLFTAGSKE